MSNLNPTQALLQRWDARFKLLGLLALVLAIATINDPALLPLVLAIPLVLAFFSGLPPSFLLRRLRYPSLLIMLLLLWLPLAVGETPWLSWGPVTLYQEGLVAALLICGRFLGIILSALVVFNTTPLATTLKAMRALGLPWVLVDMALLTLRYLQVLRHDLHQMRTVMRSRGWQNRLRAGNLQTIAWLTGSLLLRSYERADWIYRAMRLRGYGHSNSRSPEFQAGALDFLLLAFTLGTALLLVLLSFM
ncbi:cobalt ECF transporter T component CbiQ [Desulfurivibrio alkaliphilus]|uniref:Cobalt ABC transporter, inner membrane subunit CbiQ n=1 Tax=Desulfurivibrio alkaliphilus (strain DSM 19089 / UNIQEM U267 / AHT2) TaxID=589865 RepID=D6Z1K1_DESAT|nr:cobalt ECF transporter T component CbiQ [Desulfurivibrio alkaliphilus]ADH87335.1 cobalt ABC transporter, inner membrane subunit CbiQ [Desulfurivibrio alkaliphilus AHT 2]